MTNITLPEAAEGPPPEAPVDVLYVSRFYAEMAVEARYALLPDGTVWVWFHESSGYLALLVLLGSPVLGFGVGFVLAVILLVAQGVRRRLRWAGLPVRCRGGRSAARSARSRTGPASGRPAAPVVDAPP